jgi:hypothetical protein
LIYFRFYKDSESLYWFIKNQVDILEEKNVKKGSRS